VARELQTLNAHEARQLASEVERCESSAPEFAQLRLSHLVMSGIVSFSDGQRAEMERLSSAMASLYQRLGLADDSDHGVLRSTALAGVERWRTLGAAPMADVAMKEACETMAHTYESLFVQLHSLR
jgi:hypothetical protein